MIKLLKIAYAEVVELADASDSKSDGSDTVWVQVPPSAPKKKQAPACFFFCSYVYWWDLRVEKFARANCWLEKAK